LVYSSRPHIFFALRAELDYQLIDRGANYIGLGGVDFSNSWISEQGVRAPEAKDKPCSRSGFHCFT